MRLNISSALVVSCSILFVSAVSADGRGLGDFVAAGFVIPDNNPLGSQSSMSLPAFDVVGAMIVRVKFPFTPNAGGHTWCGDLVAKLTLTPDSGGPERSAFLFSRIGATSAASRGDSSLLLSEYSFSDNFSLNMWDAAASAGPDENVITGGFKPSSRSPDFQYQPQSFSAAFGNSAPAGTWTLNVSDHAAGDTGRILSWTISPFIPAPGSAGLAAAAGAVALRRRR